MRVILGPGMLPGRGDCSLSWQLSSNLPLWIEWPAVKTKGGAREAAAEGGDWLQLRRLWFAPPPGPLSFSCCPHLRFQVTPLCCSGLESNVLWHSIGYVGSTAQPRLELDWMWKVQSHRLGRCTRRVLCEPSSTPQPLHQADAVYSLMMELAVCS